MRDGGGTRTFLALLLPDTIASAAANLSAVLQARDVDRRIRWVPPANFHLTVRFFGDLDSDRIDRAASIVAALDRGYAAPLVGLGDLGAFPTSANPSVLWVGIVDPEGALRALVSRIEEALVGAAFGPADRPWKSHLTLGRAAGGRKLVPLARWTGGLTWPRPVDRIREIVLMRSELGPEGARYTPLRTAFAEA